jgi:hypothetical protein
MKHKAPIGYFSAWRLWHDPWADLILAPGALNYPSRGGLTANKPERDQA